MHSETVITTAKYTEQFCQLLLSVASTIIPQQFFSTAGITAANGFGSGFETATRYLYLFFC